MPINIGNVFIRNKKNNDGHSNKEKAHQESRKISDAKAEKMIKAEKCKDKKQKQDKGIGNQKDGKRDTHKFGPGWILLNF